MIKRKGNVYKLDTPATTMLIRAEGSAEYLYYGERLTLSLSDYAYLAEEGGEGKEKNSRLLGTDRIGADGSFLARFSFLRARIMEKPSLSPFPASYILSEEKNASQTLCLEFADKPSGLKLFLYYTVYEDCDAIAVSSRLTNAGKKEVWVRELPSLRLDLPGGGYKVSHPRKRGEKPESCPVPSEGILSEEGTGSKEGFPLSFSVLLEKPRHAYALRLFYGENYRFTAESESAVRTRVLLGTGEFMPDIRLRPEESLSSPEAVTAFAPEGESALAAIGAFAEKHVARGRWKGKDLPAAVEFCDFAAPDFSEESFSRLAEGWKNAGAELFIFDCDACKRAGQDAGQISALLLSQGLKVGIRTSLESCGEEEEICRKHPEYFLKVSGKELFRADGNCLFNLADPRAQRYVSRCLTAAVAETKAIYVGERKSAREKRRTAIADAYLPAGEFSFRFAQGKYETEEKLAEKFPAVLFGWRTESGYGAETCEGTLNFSRSTRTDELENAFERAIFGRFVYETGLTAPTGEKADAIKGQISFYKKYRETLRTGKLFFLEEDGEEARSWLCVAENRVRAVALVFLDKKKVRRLRLKGLDGNTVYEVSVRRRGGDERTDPVVVSGELLGKVGISFLCLFGNGVSENAARDNLPRLVTIEKIKKRKGP